MNTKMTTLELATKVRATLSKPRNWRKKLFHTRFFWYHRYCLLGAINRHVYGRADGPSSLMSRLDLELRYAMERELCSPAYPHFSTIAGLMRFNDDPRTKHADILRMLDGVINKLSQEQRQRQQVDQIIAQAKSDQRSPPCVTAQEAEHSVGTRQIATSDVG